ncbi:MAG: helix-turn-helix domain-containing protein [Firmicutes bacterium]|nr:helix-turn-helix domain-containing protein [Bacillota bacterium]
MTRDFKGIWIPKEIWLDENLTIMEKVFLVEIDSLDKHNECFASNNYFASFFKVTPQRASQIINSLIKKGIISAKYERNGKQVIKRVLNIFDRYQINVKRVSNKLTGGIKKSLRGYQENVKDNNTLNKTLNNTINKSKKNPKHKYGEYSHVLLTDKEYKQLEEKLGASGRDEWIKILDEGIELKGYKYASHYMAILKWHNNDKDNDKAGKKLVPDDKWGYDD